MNFDNFKANSTGLFYHNEAWTIAETLQLIFSDALSCKNVFRYVSMGPSNDL